MVKRKNTKAKHLLRSIRKSGASFFAVAFIAATSIAIFFGMQSAAEAMLRQADRYFRTNKLATWQFSCANGITTEDINAIAAWDGIETVEGGYSDTALLPWDGENISVGVLSLCQNMNLPVLVEGELPKKAGEVAVEEMLSEGLGVSVGDTISLKNDGGLSQEEFLVTAVINQPMYSCAKVTDARGQGEGGFGANEYYVMVPESAFDKEYYSGSYTTAYAISTKLAALDFYQDAYGEEERAEEKDLEHLGRERAKIRFHDLRDEVQKQIDSAENELSDAEKKIKEGEQETADKETELNNSLKKLRMRLQILGLPTDLEQAKDALSEMGNNGESLLAAITSIQDGQKSVAEAKESLAAAREELEESREKIAEGENEKYKITLQRWIISGRNEIGDVRGVETSVGSIGAVSVSLPIIFLAVAAIICYAAIARMINEQRTLIGTQKALGFTSGEILRHYLSYSLLCAVLGIAIGYSGGVIIVETLVLHVYGTHVLIGATPYFFAWKPAALSAALCFAIFLTASFTACSGLVKLPSTVLLRGEVPERGEHFFFQKWKSWKKLSLYSRTVIKNVLSDKGRMLTTVFGMMGCVALLIISFSIKFGIMNTSVIQFDRYFLYNDRLVFDSEEGNAEEYEEILREDGIANTLIQEKTEHFRPIGEEWDTARVLVVREPDQLEGFIHLEDISDGSTVEVPEDGLLVSRKCAENFNLKKGSKVEILDQDGDRRECRIAGVIEHYLFYNMFVTTESYWKSVMGEDADFSVFLLRGNTDGLKNQVQNLPGYRFLRDNSDQAADSSYVDGVVYVCIALSIFMIFLVLLNQTVMYIERKSKELAVMRINGYTMKETKAYIYKDNIVLTILGIVFGCIAGAFLSYIVIWFLEPGAYHYVRMPGFPAFLLSCIIAVVFSLIVNLIALRKIGKLSLTHI